MKAAIRKMGNSQGILIPKPVLAQVGFEGEATMTIENGALVLRPLRRSPREGWAQASKALAEEGDDADIWPAFAHSEDASLTW